MAIIRVRMVRMHVICMRVVRMHVIRVRMIRVRVIRVRVVRVGMVRMRIGIAILLRRRHAITIGIEVGVARARIGRAIARVGVERRLLRRVVGGTLDVTAPIARLVLPVLIARGRPRRLAAHVVGEGVALPDQASKLGERIAAGKGLVLRLPRVRAAPI